MCCKGLPYIVHLLNKDIIRSYPVKVNSIIEMSRPIEIQFVQSFMGSSYLSKFSLKLSETCEPPHRLLW
jgi:hypothetical protein